MLIADEDSTNHFLASTEFQCWHRSNWIAAAIQSKTKLYSPNIGHQPSHPVQMLIHLGRMEALMLLGAFSG